MCIHLVCRRSWVRSSRPARFCGVWSWNNVCSHSLPSIDPRRAVVSYWQKNGHLVLVNCLGGLPRNSVDRLTDRTVPKMTWKVSKGHKTPTQQQQKGFCHDMAHIMSSINQTTVIWSHIKLASPAYTFNVPSESMVLERYNCDCQIK